MTASTDTKTNGVATNDKVNGNGVQEPEQFGRNMLKHFLFADGYRNFNHGSFGAVAKPIHVHQQHLHTELEQAPDIFFRTTTPALLETSCRALSDLLHTAPTNLVLVPNATTGVNTVLRNLVYEPGDEIVYFATAYGACEKTVLSLTETTPVRAVKVDVVEPIGDQELLDRFERACDEISSRGGRARVAMFDTITSQPGVRMPFERLVEACKARGVLSLIDGAHGVGQIPLNLDELDADFFVSNLHKWLYTPRPSAVFYVAPRNQHLIRTTLPTSHSFMPRSHTGPIHDPLPQLISATPSSEELARQKQSSPFTTLFGYVGTNDSTPYLCVPQALAFREQVCGGEERIMKYCADLALRGGDFVAERLGTECMDNKERTLRKGVAMVNVRLPLDLIEVSELVVQPWIHKVLMEEEATMAAVFAHGGKWWVRLSAQIYLDMDDFEWVAGVLNRVCHRVKKGEHRSSRIVEKGAQSMAQVEGDH